VTYGLQDHPPRGVSLVLGLQQAILLTPWLLVPLEICRAAGLAFEGTLQMCSLALLVGAAVTTLQAGRWGSGFLCPSNVSSSIYLSPGLLAVRLGGLPLLFGMTVCAGVCEMLFSRLLVRLPWLFTPTVGGLVISLVAFELGALGCSQVLESNLVAGLVTLAVLVTTTLRGKGALRTYGILVALAAGYLVCVAQGRLDPAAWEKVTSSPWVGLPVLSWHGFAFEAGLLPTFALAGLAAALKAFATVSLCHQANGLKPEPGSLGRGVLLDGAGTVAAGMVGSLGVNPSPSAVGLSITAGITSRSVAWVTSLWLVLGALLPKLTAFLNSIPVSVTGALVLFVASSMAWEGLTLMAHSLQYKSHSIIFGLSLLMALSRLVYPAYYASLSPSWQAFTESPLTIGVLCALLLKVVFFNERSPRDG